MMSVVFALVSAYFFFTGCRLTAAACAAFVVFGFVWRWRNARPLAIGRKAVAVTGCDTGFGNMASLALDGLGYKVISMCLTEAGARSLREKASSNLVTVIGDITKADDVAKFGAAVLRECPDGLWALVNNAGITRGSLVDLTDVSTYRQVMDVNFFGHVAATRACLGSIKRARGRVVFITSIAGRIAMAGGSSYACSKHAAEAFADALRREMQMWGVSVSILEPGFMKTPMLAGVIDASKRDFAALPQEMRDAYGEEYHAKMIESMKPMLDGASDPKIVVDAVVQAVRARKPLTRYVLGGDAKFMVVLSQLPDWVTDALSWLVLRGLRPAALSRGT